MSKKIFFTKFSELENRLDPLYYSGEVKGFFKKVKYPVKNLHQMIVKIDSGVGAGKDDQSDLENGILHLRPTNVDKNGNLKLDRNIFIPFNSTYSKVDVGDIVFNNTNSQELVGKTLYIENKIDAYYSNHMTRIKVNEMLKPKYLWIILNFYQQNKIFFNLCTNWNNQSGVGLELLKNLKIVVPPIDIQNKIILKMEEANNVKTKKLKEAQKKLNSIDQYLLTELGIELLSHKKDRIIDRIFFRKYSNISGGRLDPKLYDNTTEKIKNTIEKTIFDKVKLKTLVTHSVTGDWGIEDDKDISNYKKCLVIRATEFDNLYNLNLQNSRVKHRLVNVDKLNRIDIQENDLLIEKSGGSPSQPVGRIAILSKDILELHQVGYSNFIHKIRVDHSKINPNYLFCFLKTGHNIKLTDAMQSQTNGIRNLIMSNYLNQIIPLPPLNIQNKIASHIQKLRYDSKILKEEAIQTYEDMKEEVANMIIGRVNEI